MIERQIKEYEVKTLQNLITTLISFYSYDGKDRSKVAIQNLLLVLHEPLLLIHQSGTEISENMLFEKPFHKVVLVDYRSSPENCKTPCDNGRVFTFEELK